MYCARRCAFRSTVSGSCVDCSQDLQAERMSVLCSNSGVPLSTLNWWWNVNLLHIRCDKCTRRSCQESIHCEGSSGLRLEWLLKSSETKKFLSWRVSTTLKSFLVALRLLPFSFSTIHQTDAECSQIRSEDNLLISRIQSFHLLLQVIVHDEKDYSFFFHFLS